jgi:hypothetical protein
MTIGSIEGVVAAHVKSVRFTQVVITPKSGPAFDLTQAREVVIRGAQAPAGTDVFLKLAGAGSGGVRIEASDLAGARQKILLVDGAPADAVELH